LGPESGLHRELRVEFSRCSGLLRAAQARNSLAQPQLRAAYSSLRLQSRVLRSQSGNGIGRGQDSGVDIVGNVGTSVLLSSVLRTLIRELLVLLCRSVCSGIKSGIIIGSVPRLVM
jgi:hypothetical protein